MKRIITLAILLLTFGYGMAQSPQKMSFQAVVRNNTNTLLSNQPVGLKMSILQGSATGAVVYSEMQTATTNTNGLVSIQIGGGSVLSGSFSTIDWSNGPYFIETETDVNGGTNYTLTSTTQLLSVPFALYAQTSGSSIPGPQGPIGLTGPAGTNGTNGVDGATGPQGPQGDTGLTGPAGVNGINGIDGAIGPQGIQGIKGDTGLTGPQGPIGLTGPAGANGTNGIDGATGPQGIQGIKGDTGLTGLTGPQGTIGLTGPAGANGTNGIDGATGPQGIAGTNGTNGKNTLVNTTVEPAGSNCVNGGTKIEVGLDANNDGVLEAGEVNASLTKYVCDGANIANNQSQGVRVGFSSSTTWICPVGVTQITVELWSGAGGGGGASYVDNGFCYWYGGSGMFYGNRGAKGGEGGYIKQTLTVIPNNTYNIIIGQGGQGGQGGSINNKSGQNGSNGESSSFDNLINVLPGSGGQGGVMICGCPGNTVSNGISTCSNIPISNSGSNGSITNFNYVPNPSGISYIPSSYLTLFPSSQAGAGQGGTSYRSDTGFTTINSATSGQQGYCVISY